MKWAITDPARFLYERAELDRLENESDWLVTKWRIDADDNVIVDLDLTVHGRTYAGRMTYPDVFPNSPPYIRPRDPSERWTIHQYGEGGSLCLQWRADNWQTHVTGADIIQSAFDLLSAEQHPEQPCIVPSDHHVTEGQSMRCEMRRFVATDGLIHSLIALPMQSKSTLKTHTLFNSTAIVTFASEISTVDGEVQEINDLPSGISAYFPLCPLESEGLVFRIENIITQAIIRSVDDLLHMLSEAGFDINGILEKEESTSRYKKKIILLQGASPVSGLTPLRIFWIASNEHPVLHEYKVIMPSNSDARLPKECEQLSGVRVGIVGLGSIGSKVAISLARSGLKHFLLVDDDYLVPGNMVRHELSWAFVGVHKVDAVHDMLRQIAAGLDVDVRNHRMAGQESALNAAAALRDLSNCDLLIDATANPEVFLRMAAIAKANKKPLFWGELFASGYGGLIARARPDLDPNPLAVRSAIHAHLATLPPAPFQQANGYDTDQEQPLIAHDSDVGHIATSLTRFVIDAALQHNPSQFPYSVYLIGLRREWIFEQPFDIQPIEVRGDGWDDESTRSLNREDQHMALKELLDLYKERRHAESNSIS